MQSAFRAAIRPNRVRLAALFYPAQGVSREQFGRYWLREHGKLFMSLDIVRKNITKYEQVSPCDPTIEITLDSQLDIFSSTWTTS